ncbi:hypothetical protein BH10ACT3_BH10ACT3_02710 [soil metagenome]
MKACPGCSFLIDDEQTLCSHCEADQARYEQARLASEVEKAIELPAGSTALLAPPRVAAIPESVKYRAPRRTINPKIILLLIPIGIVVVVAMAFAGQGPLADQLISRGWIERPTVIFTPSWGSVTDPGRTFEASMPAGSMDVYGPMDEASPAAGNLIGEHVAGEQGGHMEVMWSDFGMSPEAMDAYETPQGVRDLATRFIAAQKMTGEQTVSRDVIVGQGAAVDTVLVNGTIGASPDSLTSRVRFQVADGRFFALITTGPDTESRELDLAHRRLVASFTPGTD